MVTFNGKLDKKLRQVELKGMINGTAITVIVGLDGYNYKFYRRQSQWSSTLGKNVHIAVNGPLQLTFDELDSFLSALKVHVAQAKDELAKI